MGSSSIPTRAGQAIADGKPAVASSFRLHRPRGPLCGRGYCFQCDLACQTPAGPQPPVPPRDRLRPLGRLAERFPPWFYEHRFLKPRVLRGVSLHALRYLSSAPDLPATASYDGPRSWTEIEVDTVVVGAARGFEDAHRVDLANGQLAIGVYPERTLGVLDAGGLTAVRFERLVLATGSYERLPPIAGNDLPGVIGARALETYGEAGDLRAGTRIAVWAPAAMQRRMEACAERHRLELVWMSDRAPEAILGKREVAAIRSGGEVACDLFVVGVSQPAIELALQAGATARLSDDELPIVAVTDAPDWLELAGSAAAQGSGVPDVAMDDRAFACLCEDVRVGDVKACVAQGFAHPELVKRRTGAMTGPCQGKLCSAAVLAALREAGVDASPTRARPLARPVTLGELAADA